MELDALINEEFLSSSNHQHALSRLQQALAAGVRFKAKDKVVDHKPIDQLQKDIYEPVPYEGIGLDDTLAMFERKIAAHSTNFGSKNFMAFPDAGNSIAALSGAILSDFLNQNLINSKHCAPAASVVEATVITWLRSLIGYSTIERPKDIFDIGGVAVTGGVLANTTAMLLARETAFPSTKDEGVTWDPRHVKVIVPEGIDHYSIRAGLGWIGLGEKNVLRVKTDNFQICLKDLEQKISDYSQDNKILSVVSYAGDSRTMTIDRFDAIHDITKKQDIWMHVDACHGFQYAFSEALRPKLGAIELADSITTDPHKVMFLPYNLSVVLAKNPQSFKGIAGTSDLIMKEEYAFGQMTPLLGSKAFWSLKLWFLIKSLGSKNIGALIERRHALAVDLCNLLKEDECFYVLNRDVNINSVVFMYLPGSMRKKSFLSEDEINSLNTLNKAIQDHLFCEGSYYLHTFSIPDFSGQALTGGRVLQPLRYMGGNPTANVDDIQAMIARVKEIGDMLSR